MNELKKHHQERGTLSVRQLALRWGVGEQRIRSLIDAGFLLGAFKVPSSGKYGETIRIPIEAVRDAESEWAIESESATGRKKRRPKRRGAKLNHFPELSSPVLDSASPEGG